MQVCINQATTMTTDFATDLHAYAEAGFESVELWLPKLESYLGQGHSLDSAQLLCKRLGLKAVAACAQGNCLVSSGEERAAALAQLRRRAMLCRALGAETLVVYSENPESVDSATYALAAANLAEACDVAAEFEVTIALEFIKGSRLVGCLTTALEVIREAARPNLGLLFDTFHFYAGISKLEDLEAMEASVLALVHINDARHQPRELWTDHDRVLLGHGVLPLTEILGIIEGKGYEGYYSLELFNRELWEESPSRAARLAYENLTDFLAHRL